MKIVCCVPVKLNNERLPGKNIMEFGGKPLVQHILGTLVQIKEIDEICVYCSDAEIQQYMPNSELFLKRPEFLNRSDTNFSQIFGEFIKEKEADVYVYAHVTAPFVSKESIVECINAVINEEYDSAFTATVIHDFLWQDGKPLNFNATDIPRSQDLRPVFRETSGVYVFQKDVFTKYHRRIGMNPYIKGVGYKESMDINTQEDFDLAKFLLNYKEGII